MGSDAQHHDGTYRLSNTVICSATAVEAPERVTSAWIDEQLAETYQRLGMSPGKFEQLAGVVARRWWPEGVSFSEGAAEAGAKALAEAGVEPGQVGLLINSSVSHDHLEPSAAVQVHDAIGLSRTCLNFDLSNACLGFINGMQVAGTMIDAGQIDYALIVNSENVRGLQEKAIARLQRPETTVAEVREQFATLTLGCGATAMVLGRADKVSGGHRLLGGSHRAATHHNNLCVGDMSFMRTDTRGLFEAGLQLALETFLESEEEFGWSDVDHLVSHQTSLVHITALCQKLGLDQAKFPLSLPEFGNMGPAAAPFTLAASQDRFRSGDRVMLLGIGSGLNTSFADIVW
ncbi:3-oxoacyl-ACP synthase III [Auraticoccus sp. F435]|uniref:3-oxoacyl-ACP synthase III n=1 Tax=Auraticoccus cholistanensis TaxID=2656650 RepID=A0A6A9UQQ3_9ACTN|nr:3-oxoacyl-ACP synthase III [Auraticoccus cholistanensis]MVA74898.1 3-oxoacyl-ACP synthase III [Auraticoccus cholistanensis]